MPAPFAPLPRAVLLLPLAIELLPIAIAFWPLALALLPRPTVLTLVAFAFTPNAALLAPVAVARLPTAVANAPVPTTAPAHWVWPGVGVAQSCAIASVGARPMASNKEAVRFARTSVFERAVRAFFTTRFPLGMRSATAEQTLGLTRQRTDIGPTPDGWLPPGVGGAQSAKTRTMGAVPPPSVHARARFPSCFVPGPCHRCACHRRRVRANARERACRLAEHRNAIVDGALPGHP